MLDLPSLPSLPFMDDPADEPRGDDPQDEEVDEPHVLQHLRAYGVRTAEQLLEFQEQLKYHGLDKWHPHAQEICRIVP